MTWQEPIERTRTTLVAVRALLEGARRPLEREGVWPLRWGTAERSFDSSGGALAPASVVSPGSSWMTGAPFLWRDRGRPTAAPAREGEARGAAVAPRGQGECAAAIAADEDRAGQVVPVVCPRPRPERVRCIGACSRSVGFAQGGGCALRANEDAGPAPPAAAERLAGGDRWATYDEALDAMRQCWKAAPTASTSRRRSDRRRSAFARRSKPGGSAPGGTSWRNAWLRGTTGVPTATR